MLLDPTGQAGQYLKYRARYLHVMKRGDFDKESLRKAVVQCLHNGGWMVMDFDSVDVDLPSLFEPTFFTEAVLSPMDIFNEEHFGPLLRKSDEFTAKVTYEHQAALAEGAFQDRTKCHAPERVADIDKRFDPKDSFRFIVTGKKEVPEALASKMHVLKINVSEQEKQANAGVWAGGAAPEAKKSSEQVKLDNECLECAFDGDTDEVSKLLQKGADMNAVDGRGCTPLAEAAVGGHVETVRVLLDWKAPLGSNPNKAGSDKRTPLHRAAFGGFHETVQLLLERGADKRLKDRSGQTPFDLAGDNGHQETMKIFEAWDDAKTDQLLEERRIAQDVEDEKNVKNDEERKQLEKRKKMEALSKLIEEGDKDIIEGELLTLEDDAKVETFRDLRGNTVLHLAAEVGNLELAMMFIKEYKVSVNCRDAKGWTPLAIVTFRGHKKMIKDLVTLKADPAIPNSYNKTAWDVAKDDEIKQTLQEAVDGPSVAAQASASAPASASTPTEETPASPKAKAKGKAKAKAGGGDAGSRSNSGTPKGKAKAKAKSKR
eukprot:TRINITY_DN14762_c0_g1_i1.p1 TRINITY_DN14762_c0_g1~~TRINITY_DN14762_c0_g1_i1.p1  ORF type:complete len:579 (+),score=146.94 TRINITY_DN14762_c0_g1_i1:111-1739(+)